MPADVCEKHVRQAHRAITKPLHSTNTSSALNWTDEARSPSKCSTLALLEPAFERHARRRGDTGIAFAIGRTCGPHVATSSPLEDPDQILSRLLCPRKRFESRLHQPHCGGSLFGVRCDSRRYRAAQSARPVCENRVRLDASSNSFSDLRSSLRVVSGSRTANSSPP